MGIVFGLLIVGLMVAIAVATFGSGRTATRSAYAYADPAPAPALALVDQDGEAFTLADLRGRPVLVYFGYTHCPDVCPASMASYVRYLSPEYIGLTGTPAQIRAAADGYGVTYSRIDTTSASGYAMAHTAELYLIDARGRLRSHYPFGIEATEVVADLHVLAAE
jgi:protein SCO1/2